jgi:hypothetical protein
MHIESESKDALRTYKYYSTGYIPGAYVLVEVGGHLKHNVLPQREK